MVRAVFRIVLSLVVAVAGLFVAALVLPPNIFNVALLLVPLELFALTWVFTRATGNQSPRKVAISTPEVKPLPSPAQLTVGQRKARMWMSVTGLVAFIGAIFGWSYYSSEQSKAEDLTYALEAKAQEMIGNEYVVEGISFPTGTSAYEYPVSVKVTRVEGNAPDLFTLFIRGDCSTVCNIRMDPRDVFRFR